MLKIKNNTQKTLSIIGIVGLLLANMFPSIVNAADITIPDSLLASITTSGATYPILNSTDNQGSSSNKQQLPQVTVNFSEDALSQAGTKKMVATATPSYFKKTITSFQCFTKVYFIFILEIFYFPAKQNPAKAGLAKKA